LQKRYGMKQLRINFEEVEEMCRAEPEDRQYYCK
jgi:hypothetical protein